MEPLNPGSMWTPNEKGLQGRRTEDQGLKGYMRPYLKKKYRKEINTPMPSASFSYKVLLFLEEGGARTREKTADLLA